MRSSQNFLAIDSVAFGDAAGEVFNEIVDRSIVLEHPGTFHPFEVRGALGFFQHIIEDEKGQAEQSVFFPDAEKDDAVSPAGKIPGPEKMPRGQKPYAAVEALQERGVIGKGDHASGGLIAVEEEDKVLGIEIGDQFFDQGVRLFWGERHEAKILAPGLTVNLKHDFGVSGEQLLQACRDNRNLSPYPLHRDRTQVQ